MVKSRQKSSKIIEITASWAKAACRQRQNPKKGLLCGAPALSPGRTAPQPAASGRPRQAIQQADGTARRGRSLLQLRDAPATSSSRSAPLRGRPTCRRLTRLSRRRARASSTHIRGAGTRSGYEERAERCCCKLAAGPAFPTSRKDLDRRCCHVEQYFPSLGTSAIECNGPEASPIFALGQDDPRLYQCE